MLRRLEIRNFAVMESLDLRFEGGLSVFTGETGAGKSILIEALGFLMGARGTTDWIRAGARTLEVCGTFDSPEGSRRFTLRRELDANGRSRALLDKKPLALSVLSKLSPRLVDFHGQHDHQNLLKPASQLEFLDSYGDRAERLAQVGAAYEKWREAAAERETLELSEDERLRRIDLLKFQIEEIDAVNPQPDEDKKLAMRLPRIKNAEKLRTLASRAYQELYGREESVEGGLRSVEGFLEEMSALDSDMKEHLTAVRGARESASDVAAELARYRERADESGETIDDIIGRQDKIARLIRKYGPEIPDVLEFGRKAKEQCQALEDHKARRKEVERHVAQAERLLRSLSASLHKERSTAARRLAARVTEELHALGMPAARLSISVEMEEDLLTAAGSDRVEFLLAPNPGEPLKSLRSIASGGELSRVMLGLKSVLSRQDRVGLMVFDEVDTGVGAAVGAAVGQKLSRIAASRQVFCVTHLAQVACCAQNHFQVVKSVSAGRTYTRVDRLEGDLRVEAVARMLGGRKTTAASRRHAKELMASV